jgi:uncharacterized membrane protein YtjA (UPF0391 family)
LRQRRLAVQWSVAIFRQETAMLKWALIFAVIALVAGVFGFTGIAAGAAGIAKFLFFVFVALCVLALILGATVFKAVKD